VKEPAQPAEGLAVGPPHSEVRVWPLRGIGEVHPGDDLAGLIATAASDPALADGDILAVTQKIVSKAEGRIVDLATVEPSPFAAQFAAAHGKDPRHVEVVLAETRRIVKMDRGLLIAETRHGFICANAGVDASNVPGDGRVVLLPVDPDASAERIRQGLAQRLGITVGVVICDTFGRVWRTGLTNVAIGVAGLRPLLSYVGQTDPYGYDLRVTEIAVADEIAAAAELVMGKTAGHPVVVARGLSGLLGEGSARALVRAAEHDLFR
jgi:coenzyme F420-0:L-glutamate ligase/coenzyme F420-1:gamma-L-glutamate ligase